MIFFVSSPLIVLAAFLIWQPTVATVEPHRAELPGFAVIGLTTRTTNKAEMSGSGKLGPLWAAFAGSSKRIPDVVHSDVAYSIYTGYATDESGPYDVILGKEVSNLAHVPEGMRSIQIPAAHYLVFPVANSSPQGIGAAWGAVYKYFATHKSNPRTYGIDFDRHENGAVAIYVSVR